MNNPDNNNFQPKSADLGQHDSAVQSLNIRLKLLKGTTHRFHILRPSVYPFATSILLLAVLISICLYLNSYTLFNGVLPAYAFALVFYCVCAWFKSITNESTRGFHTTIVRFGLQLGILLFIVSEVMFFFGFFWAFFHMSLAPSAAVGSVWPAPGTQKLNPWTLPLVNTLILLSSGVTVTWAHSCLLTNQNRRFRLALGQTVALGLCFLTCQAYEYKYGTFFSWRDNIFGTLFFVLTGFHGLHVCIGTALLAHNWMRSNTTTATKDLHVGFEAAAWYWHFVDVVWLFLFIFVYVWSAADQGLSLSVF